MEEPIEFDTYNLKSDDSAESKLSWSGLTVTVKDRQSGEPLQILKHVSGAIKPGDMMALVGPSGSGKTTLLNVLAHRRAAASASVEGDVLLDGQPLSRGAVRQLTTYVEQEDNLIGSLTVRETVEYSARLASVSVGDVAHKGRTDELIRAFGLTEQRNAKIGTPLQKGISGGQKRRVSIASQLITQPRILFLDEPTSGLDSTASFEVMSRIKKVALAENMIVVASIHQPSTATFNLFSHITLLSRGQTVYCGESKSLLPYLESVRCPAPLHMNPAEFIIELVNTDFQKDEESVDERTTRLRVLQDNWTTREEGAAPTTRMTESAGNDQWRNRTKLRAEVMPWSRRWAVVPRQTGILVQRSLMKAYRDLLAYYVRFVMYLGLAIMMGTVWLRLDPTQINIQPFINAIFFSGAFMSFMAVAYIPAYLEDYSSFIKEQQSGLYGPTAFLLSNFIVGVPFLFGIAAMFSIVTYFLVHFRPSGNGFWMYLMWLFLDLLAAESLVVLVSSLVPIFVAALALTAFANGLWMSVGGFLVSSNVLNVFWYYTFYWIDYQRYVFQGMMFNEFQQRTYACGEGCHCMYTSELEAQCQIAGTGVLSALGYGSSNVGLWIGVLIALIAGMRMITWAWLIFKR